MGKNISINKLCRSCMNQKDDADSVCPICGFDKKWYSVPREHLRLDSILRSKYLVGRTVAESENEISYIGWDLSDNKRVLIQEYYPKGLVCREKSDEVTVLVDNNILMFKECIKEYIYVSGTLTKANNVEGIAPILDVFEENHTVYQISEYPDGITAEKYLQINNGKISVDEMLDMFEPILVALDTIHKRGILHRNVRIENIVITRDGEVKIMGMVAAVEFDRSNNPGPWIDVYDSCAAMYKLITGQDMLKKFSGEVNGYINEREIIEPSRYGIQISKEIERALLKGISSSIKERYATVSELYTSLYDENNEACSVTGDTIALNVAQPNLKLENNVSFRKDFSKDINQSKDGQSDMNDMNNMNGRMGQGQPRMGQGQSVQPMQPRMGQGQPVQPMQPRMGQGQPVQPMQPRMGQGQLNMPPRPMVNQPNQNQNTQRLGNPPMQPNNGNAPRGNQPQFNTAPNMNRQQPRMGATPPQQSNNQTAPMPKVAPVQPPMSRVQMPMQNMQADMGMPIQQQMNRRAPMQIGGRMQQGSADNKFKNNRLSIILTAVVCALVVGVTLYSVVTNNNTKGVSANKENNPSTTGAAQVSDKPEETLPPIEEYTIPEWKSSVVEKFARDTTGIEEGEISTKDLQTVQEINLKNQGIDDLSDFVHFQRLKVLSLERNAITDLSPLKQIDTLEELKLTYNETLAEADLSPLNEMKNLKKVDLKNCRIKNFDAVKDVPLVAGRACDIRITFFYTRSNADYDGWNLYTWTSNGTQWDFEITDDVASTTVFLENQIVDKVGFIVRKSNGDDPWAEKDTQEDRYVELKDNRNGLTEITVHVTQGVSSFKTEY